MDAVIKSSIVDGRCHQVLSCVAKSEFFNPIRTRLELRNIPVSEKLAAEIVGYRCLDTWVYWLCFYFPLTPLRCRQSSRDVGFREHIALPESHWKA
jgi:hypothetical protein